MKSTEFQYFWPMKIGVIIFFSILIFSCGENNERQSTGLVSELAEVKNLQNNDENPNSGKIISFNFDQLEKKYFQKNNDSIYVINFWATWCKPCVKELPAFERISADYSSKKVKVLLVSLDFADKIESQVIPFNKKNNIKSEVVLLDDPDANNWIPRVSKEWSGAIPATIIYNKKKRKFYEQSFTFEELETELKAFLKK
ncbi:MULTISPECIES: TlpA disulfide reductase family protein [Aequorivita]|nr:MULTISPECIES: TlpA disulfide reductase family protein [Aequorivita]UCA56595.1 TlpA family protein disulfide reductase [Aequorivita sp. F7]